MASISKQLTTPIAQFTLLLSIALLSFFTACKPTSALYDADTFSRTTALKAKTIKLMDHGTEAYSKYKTDARAVLDEAVSLYEKQKTRKTNELSVKQWQLLLEPDATTKSDGILSGFFKEWENAKTPLTNFYIQEKRKKIAEAFDEILKLEGAKSKK